VPESFVFAPIRVALLVLTLCAAAAAAAQPASQHTVPDTLAQRVQACTICHGKEGRATSDGYFPRIAGKPSGYLFNQLVHFRDGRRQNATMTHLVDLLTDDYLREIAGHFAALDLPYPPPPAREAPAAQLQPGEALVRRGDPARKLPACSACHGERLTGVQPTLPGLLGLPRDYLIAQFGQWVNGKRKATAPDCMAEIARKLTTDEIGAVATWLSVQPAVDAKPAASLPAPLPLRCGSIDPAAEAR
jgi:cytochrome c553